MDSEVKSRVISALVQAELSGEARQLLINRTLGDQPSHNKTNHTNKKQTDNTAFQQQDWLTQLVGYVSGFLQSTHPLDLSKVPAQ